jgi:predicted dehydrogenase
VTVAVGVLSPAHVHADAWAAALAGADGAELAGVADDDAERGRAFADRHDTELVDAADLAAAVDAAVVTAPNARHLDWIESAAAAGADVLCEKPLMPTVAGCDRAIATCADAGVELGVAMPLRFSVPARRAREALEAGAVGDLGSISGANRSAMPGGWFADPDLAGGGAVVDHTVHLVDLVHWLTGERVAEVYGEQATRLHDVPVEDVNVLSMELTDGTAFLLDGSWSTPQEWDFWGDARIELLGDDGSVAVDCFGQTFRRTRDPPGHGGRPPVDGRGDAATGIDRVYWGSDPELALIEEFVDAVAAGREPAVTGAEGRAAVAVVEAAYESAERGEPVAVDY